MNVSGMPRRRRLAYLRAYQSWRAEERARIEPMGFIPGAFICGFPVGVEPKGTPATAQSQTAQKTVRDKVLPRPEIQRLAVAD